MTAAPGPGAKFCFFLQICGQHERNITFLFCKLISCSSNRKFRFFICLESAWMPAAPEPGAQFCFFLQICNQHKGGVTFRFYGLISDSSNKKFRFLPVRSPPGCLQRLNLEPSFVFFFKYENNMEEYDISV